MSPVKVKNRLASLPATDDNAFFLASREAADELIGVEAALKNVAKSSTEAQDIRIRALYFLLHRLRHQRNHREYRRLVDDFRKDLGSLPLFRTFEVVYERSLGDDVRSMARAVRASRRCLETYVDSPGVLHQFAELVITDHEINRQTKSEILQEAEKAAERAISLSSSPNPHYWNTLARLQSALNDFRAARRSILEAIELEDAEGPEYAVRLSEHQLVETRVYFAEERRHAEQREEEARGELRSTRTQMLEILGLLAAIIAFLTTSAAVTSGRTFDEAARLLVVSASLVMVVFSVFAYAFRISSLARLLLPLAAGVGAFVASLFLG